MTEPGTPVGGSGWSRRHHFAFAASYRLPALAFGITPMTSWVDVGPSGLRVRFGPWRLQTTLDNIASVQLTGDFGWLKTVGPPHLSLADRGVTFATNGEEAVCLELHSPVAGIDPTRRITHRGATMTVEHPASLVLQLADLREQAGLTPPG